MKGEIHHFRRFHASKILFLCTIFLLLNIPTSHQTVVSVEHHASNATDGPRHHRRLLSYNDDSLAVEPGLELQNPRLRNAYIALQAWKEAILSDPMNVTVNWVGEDVCNYTGVFCWPTPDYPHELTVAGIDLNHADVAGSLPHELGLLYDLALFHINSNRFCGAIPQSFVNFKRLHELDLSNNRFAGMFPKVILELPSLRYLDIRFNEFEGELPRRLFEIDFDAIFLNNNRFSSGLPDNFGKSRVSVLVLAHNNFGGCVPHSIGEMDGLEQLNLAHNMMSGKIGDRICELPNLVNFEYGYNFFSEESSSCQKLHKFGDGKNCFRDRPNQRSTLDCQRFLSRTVDCNSFNCHKLDPATPPGVLPCTPPSPPPSPAPPSASPSSPSPVPSATPAQPIFSPPPPTNPPPRPPPQPSTPPLVQPDISPSPTLPPIIPSPAPSNSTTPMCPCQQPPPQPSNPPSNF